MYNKAFVCKTLNIVDGIDSSNLFADFYNFLWGEVSIGSTDAETPSKIRSKSLLVYAHDPHSYIHVQCSCCSGSTADSYNRETEHCRVHIQRAQLVRQLKSMI